MTEKDFSSNSFYFDLLEWYDSQNRRLPWRAQSGVTPDPYIIWISEIMLQQTTVKTVSSRFPEFISRWPSIKNLAYAKLDKILHSWQGLGYYARARNLHSCAKIVVKTYGGHFPQTEIELAALPGIGAYTAAAISAIAFNNPVLPIDSNIARVLSRVNAIEDPVVKSMPLLIKKAQELARAERPGDFAQAMMDLGSLVCKPTKPICCNCPIHKSCKAGNFHNPENFPKKLRKKMRPTRWGIVFWAKREDGTVFFRRRPLSGLLGGMIELPGSKWVPKNNIKFDRKTAPFPARWHVIPGEVKHSFSHFNLVLKVAIGETKYDHLKIDGFWHSPHQIEKLALPTLTKKVIKHVQRHNKTA